MNPLNDVFFSHTNRKHLRKLLILINSHSIKTVLSVWDKSISYQQQNVKCQQCNRLFQIKVTWKLNKSLEYVNM